MSNENPTTTETQGDSNAQGTAPAGDPNAGQAELILGKFKTNEDVHKAYTELESKFHGKVPKEYAFDHLEDDNFKFSKDSVVFKGFVDMAKQQRLSQEQVDALLGAYKQDLLSKQINIADEIKKLGPDGQEQISIMQTWLENNLSPESAVALMEAAKDHRFVRAFQEIRSKMRQQPVPVGDQQGFGRPQALTEEQIKNKMIRERERYHNDPEFRKEIENDWKALLGQR